MQRHGSELYIDRRASVGTAEGGCVLRRQRRAGSIAALSSRRSRAALIGRERRFGAGSALAEESSGSRKQLTAIEPQENRCQGTSDSLNKLNNQPLGA